MADKPARLSLRGRHDPSNQIITKDYALLRNVVVAGESREAKTDVLNSALVGSPRK
jgi:hypothetical protein